MENEENIVINPNVSKTVSYYEDIFCDAVSTIVQGHLQGVSFDRTVLCKIADDTQREQGVYIVTENNSTKFEAVSNDTTYRKNQNVYVQIPSGDWNQQKLIVGKKVDTTIEPYTYQKPFFNLIDISKNLISGELGKDGIGLIANEITTIKLPTEEKEELAWDKDPKQSILLWTYNCTDEKRAVLKDSGQNLSGFSKIGIQASFKTNLNPFYIDGENTPKYVTHGQYGLCLQVYTGQYKTDEQEKEVELFHSFYLNQEDMNGSIYDFNTFFLQEKVFDIANINKITKMKLFFYQTPGTFMDNEGNLSPSTPGGFLNTFIKPNLFVKDLYISLGYDSSSFTGEEKIEIFSQDSPIYSTDFDNNNKNISLRWLHKAPNGDFISITKEDDIDFELRWYRYKLGAQATDEYSSDNWALLSTQTKDDLIIADADWLIYNDSNIENRKYPEFFSTWLFPNLSVSTEQIKAVIIYNNKAYTSNILKFENGNEVINIPSIEAVQALTLRYSDKGLNGNYQLYGQNNLIIEESQARAVHNFIPYFLTHSQELEGEPEILKTAESVEWTVPVKNTMLIFNDLPQDGEEDKEGNYHFKKGEAPYHLSYRINNYYSPNDTNNTVICKVYKNGILYTALLTPSFGFFNNEEAENRLILNFYDENSAVTINGDLNKSVKVIATLYDGENKKVDLSNTNIKWTWKTKNSDLN